MASIQQIINKKINILKMKFFILYFNDLIISCFEHSNIKPLLSSIKTETTNYLQQHDIRRYAPPALIELDNYIRDKQHRSAFQSRVAKLKLLHSFFSKMPYRPLTYVQINYSYTAIKDRLLSKVSLFELIMLITANRETFMHIKKHYEPIFSQFKSSYSFGESAMNGAIDQHNSNIMPYLHAAFIYKLFTDVVLAKTTADINIDFVAHSRSYFRFDEFMASEKRLFFHSLENIAYRVRAGDANIHIGITRNTYYDAQIQQIKEHKKQNSSIPCPACGGYVAVEDGRRRCPRCQGYGRIHNPNFQEGPKPSEDISVYCYIKNIIGLLPTDVPTAVKA